MKRITKKIFIVLVAVAFVATGCKKESEYKTVTLGAKIAPGNSKVYIDGYTPKWNGGDVVNVNGNPITVSNVNGASAELHDVTESDDGYYAYYPAGDVTGFNNGQFTVTLPAIQEYEETIDANSQTVQLIKAPMGAKTGGGSLTFHNLCSLLKITVSAEGVMKIREIKVTAETSNLSGSATITLTGNESDALSAPATGSKSVTLSFGDSGKTLSAGDYDFFIYLPAFGSSENRENVCVEVYNIDANNVLGVCKKEFTDIYVIANTINTVGTGSLTAASFTTTGALSGLFSVSADKKVRFSRGNLQAVCTSADGNSSTSETFTWRFAEHQYDYIGNTTANTAINGNGSVSTVGTVDLFGWSTNATAFGIHNSKDYNTYSGNFRNWGVNDISNGGGANKWRTLTAVEWDSLLNNNDRGGTRYAKCVITDGSSYNGLIIFPDGFTAPSGITINSANTINAAYTTNSFDAVQWSTLQNAGCVFLPAAGIRQVSTVSNDGSNGYSNGYYWSSSAYDASYAWCLYFFKGNVNTKSKGSRWDGRSVRLVQDY